MQPVCHRSLSELRISVRTMFKDDATLYSLGLIKQVLHSRDSLVVVWQVPVEWSSSLGEGSSSGEAGGSLCRGAARQPAAAAAAAEQLHKRGSLEQQQQQLHSSGQSATAL